LFYKDSADIISGYFGKLPEFNDFIKYNAGSSEILYIDKWLQEGLAQAKLKLKDEWKMKYSSIPPTNFFISIPSSQKTAAGILYPGNDKSGREFPFIIFLLTSGKLFDPFYLMPAELEKNLLSLDKILREEENISSLNNALKNNDFSLPPNETVIENFLQYLSISKINEFITRTGCGRLKENIKDIMIQNNSVIRILFTSGDEYFSYDAGFLIYILQKKINLSVKNSSVFWNNRNDGQYQIIIFPFNLTSLNFTDLLSFNINDERLIDLNFSAPGQREESNLTLEEYIQTL